MPKPASKSTVVVDGTTLDFTQNGNYTIDFLPSGNVKIKLDGGHAFVMRADEFDAIETLNVSGITFHEADGTGSFETSRNLDDLLGALITEKGIDYVIDHLTINASKTDAFKMLWDYLDDAYVAGGNPFNVALNETFVRLGVAYVEYLEAGGEPLTFVTAKFTADDADANTMPEREQSMHDNLLGNLTAGAINARFSGDPDLKAELLALIPDEYEARLLYEGNESQVGGPRHDNVRQFDYDHGWDRPDYLERDYNADIHPLARDGGEMYYGDGNTIDDWTIVRHEGAQVELGLKVKHRQGDEYAEASIDGNGVAHYIVEDGPQPGNPNRAEWNFDFAATDYSADDDFTYVVELDIDPTDGVQWVTVHSTDDPHDTDTGMGETFQNSFNVAFVDLDPVAPDTQHYGFGEAEFNVRISAFDSVSGDLVAVNEVVVHVGA